MTLRARLRAAARMAGWIVGAFVAAPAVLMLARHPWLPLVLVPVAVPVLVHRGARVRMLTWLRDLLDRWAEAWRLRKARQRWHRVCLMVGLAAPPKYTNPKDRRDRRMTAPAIPPPRLLWADDTPTGRRFRVRCTGVWTCEDLEADDRSVRAHRRSVPDPAASRRRGPPRGLAPGLLLARRLGYCCGCRQRPTGKRAPSAPKGLRPLDCRSER